MPVSQSHAAVEAMLAGDAGATLLKRVQRRLGLKDREAKSALVAYKKFLELKAEHEDWDATKLSPPPLIDEVWHLHVLDTQAYGPAMRKAFGRIVHHDPDGDEDADARAERIVATRAALRGLFKTRYDKKIWTWAQPARKRKAAIVEDEVSDDDVAPTPRRLAPKVAPKASPRATTLTSGESIRIRIRYMTGEEMFFKGKTTTKLDTFFNAYATRKGVAATSLRFLFDGSRVRGDQTPADIDMRDGDQLDCMCEQQGC